MNYTTNRISTNTNLRNDWNTQAPYNQNDLRVPLRIQCWATQQKQLKSLLECKYGDALLEAYRKLKPELLYQSAGHGIGHIERVMLYGALIAMYENLNESDTQLLLNCCSYHDIGRINDEEDRLHGIRSSQMIHNSGLQFLFDDVQMAEGIIAAHSVPDAKALEIAKQYKIDDSEYFLRMLRYLKDADCLDRVRFADFDPKYLRNESSGRVSRIVDWVLTAYEKISTL